jgi:hypothetical protein
MSQNSMVLDQFRSDPRFVVDFIVDNNPSEVQARLSGLNLLDGYPQEDSRESLLSDIYSIDEAGTIQEVLSVPYINENGNYTGGYEQQLSVQGSAIGGEAKGTGWVAIMDGVFELGAGISNAIASGNAVEIAEIQAEQQQELLAWESAEAEKSKIFGFPPQVFMAIIGAVVVISVFALISMRK